LFFPSETSSPLIHQFSQLIVTKYGDLGDVLLQLLLASKNVPGFLEFIITYSPLVSTLVDLTRDAVCKKAADQKVSAFSEYLNMAVAHAPVEFSAAFATKFEESVLKPLVLECPRLESLVNSIYILSLHSALGITRPVIDFALGHLQSDLKSEDPQIVFLTVRLVTLLLDKGQWKLPLAPPSVQISLDFMGLINSEWFVRSDINQQLQNARALVSMSLAGIPNEAFEFDLEPILPVLLEKLSQFPANSVRLNLALTEFFAALAAKWGNEATFFAFSNDCEGGLCKVLGPICLTLERRVGQKAGTIQGIERAYQLLEAKGEDSESELFVQLVVLLEFLKELHAIAQTKNLLRQRDQLFVG
jgi:hypothetical protein